jgi:hypothetical protein
MSACVSSGGQSSRTALRSRQRVDFGTGEESVDLGTKSHTFVAVAMSACVSSGGQSSRTALRSRQRVDFGTGEESVDLVVQRPLVLDQLAGKPACTLEQLAVGAQTREAELRKAGLARSE